MTCVGWTRNVVTGSGTTGRGIRHLGGNNNGYKEIICPDMVRPLLICLGKFTALPTLHNFILKTMHFSFFRSTFVFKLYCRLHKFCFYISHVQEFTSSCFLFYISVQKSKLQYKMILISLQHT